MPAVGRHGGASPTLRTSYAQSVRQHGFESYGDSAADMIPETRELIEEIEQKL